MEVFPLISVLFQVQKQEQSIEPKRRRRQGSRPMGEISGCFGYEGYGGDGQSKEMFSEDDRRTQGNASVPPPRKVLANLPPHKVNSLNWSVG